MIQALFRCPFNSLQWLQCIVFGCFCLLLSYYGNFSHGDTGCFGTKLLEKPRVPNKRSTMGALGASGLGRSREFIEKINCWIGFRDLMYLYIYIIYYLYTTGITSNHIKSPDLMVPDPRAASKSLPNSLVASRASYSICTVIKFETAKPFPWKGSSKHQPKGLRWMTLVFPGSLQFLRLSALVQAQVWRRLQHQRSHSFESLEQASRLRLPSWLYCKCECYMLRDVTRLLELSYPIETSTSQHYLDLPLLVLAAFRCLSHTRCLENWDMLDRPRMC